MKAQVFWLRHVSLGRVHVALGRNDAIYARKRGWSTHFSRMDGNFFGTFRIGTRFLNIDIV